MNGECGPDIFRDDVINCYTKVTTAYQNFIIEVEYNEFP